MLSRREYNIALRTELARKELRDDPKRAAELAAYMTHAGMSPLHKSLALRSAMGLTFRLKCFATCAVLCRRLIELNPGQKVRQTICVCLGWERL